MLPSDMTLASSTFAREKRPTSSPGHRQCLEEAVRCCHLRRTAAVEEAGAAKAGTAPAAGMGVASPSTSPSHVCCQQQGLEAAGFGYSHALCTSPSLPPTPKCLCKENYPFLRLNLFRDFAGLHTAAITGNPHFRGNSGSWCLAKPPKSFLCHAKSPLMAPLWLLLTEGWVPAGTPKSQPLLPAPTPAGNPALLLQELSTKPWAALPSKQVSKAQAHYIKIIRMLLVTYPSGSPRAATRYLMYRKSSLTLTSLIPTSSPKISQKKTGTD